MVMVVRPNNKVIPMMVSVTDANSDAADPDFHDFRHDHWFIAGVR
jgi:hypothetical protein